MATTNFKGQPVKLIGEFIQVGKVAPDFELVKNRFVFFLIERSEWQECDSEYFPKSGYQCLCYFGTQI